MLVYRQYSYLLAQSYWVIDNALISWLNHNGLWTILLLLAQSSWFIDNTLTPGSIILVYGQYSYLLAQSYWVIDNALISWLSHTGL
ncbi:hypothetical protein RRG08_030066 [Elysia crispata]|uniref:Uncharacterized protein n=1 Tax=Elysia crispata TaxID=231223 RepID=A0AAE0YJD6_9GAST|nr:hypothetical protein RRG08_030066 [Elysia crispata]